MDWNGWITWTIGTLSATVHWLEAHPGTASWLEAVGSIAAIVFVYLFALFQGRRANSHQNTDRIRRAQGLALLLIPVLAAFKPKLEMAILHEKRIWIWSKRLLCHPFCDRAGRCDFGQRAFLHRLVLAIFAGLYQSGSAIGNGWRR